MNKIARLWISQKHCVRVLFGDKEAFLDKFRTAARARPYKNQLLGEDFYRQEHTKPLFTKHKILALKNLYCYHTFMEVLKILKLRDPITLYEQYTLSERKPTLIINSNPVENFIPRSTRIWNIVSPKLKLNDFSFKISSTKNSLKAALLRLQGSDDPVAWTSNNFNPEKINEQS